jgi:hypothetical protein
MTPATRSDLFLTGNIFSPERFPFPDRSGFFASAAFSGRFPRMSASAFFRKIIMRILKKGGEKGILI